MFVDMVRPSAPVKLKNRRNKGRRVAPEAAMSPSPGSEVDQIATSVVAKRKSSVICSTLMNGIRMIVAIPARSPKESTAAMENLFRLSSLRCQTKAIGNSPNIQSAKKESPE